MTLPTEFPLIPCNSSSPTAASTVDVDLSLSDIAADLFLPSSFSIENDSKSSSNDLIHGIRNKQHEIHLGQEIEEGNIEYKLKLIEPNDERILRLVTQMNWRLNEGNGEAIYEIGVQDSGFTVGINPSEMEQSLATLKDMAERIDAEIEVLKIRPGIKKNKVAAQVRVRRKYFNKEILREIRVAVIGNVESGKSTLISVLTKGFLDNGQGLARMQVLRHPHEIEHGRTSSISRQLFVVSKDEDFGESSSSKNSMPLGSYLEKIAKIITFCDLAGHERYLKTTASCLTGHLPDYAMLVVDAQGGVQKMTLEHSKIAVALNIPIFIVITKVDLASEETLCKTITSIQDLLKSLGLSHQLDAMSCKEDIERTTQFFNSKSTTTTSLPSTTITPMFITSSVSGVSLELLRSFLGCLQPNHEWEMRMLKQSVYHIEDMYNLIDVGTVLTGIVHCGQISIGDELLLGPEPNGNFQKIKIQSIHNRRKIVPSLVAGETGSLSIESTQGNKLDSSLIRRGSLLIHPSIQPRAAFRFDAHIRILDHPTNIRVKYEVVVHAGTIRQVARIIDMNVPLMRQGDESICRFEFLRFPEYIYPNLPLIFREGKTNAVGKVIRPLYI